MSSRANPKWLAKGLALAFCWGIATESWILLFTLDRATFGMPRAARLLRTLETAGTAAAFALLMAVTLALLPPIRRWAGSDRSLLLSLCGLAASLWLTWVFVAVSPAIDAIRLTTDPIALRFTTILTATPIIFLAGFFGFQSLRDGSSIRLVQVSKTAPIALALLGAAALITPSFENEAQTRRADIFLFSVDTLRADHLGCYGYALTTSPNLDRFCEEAIVFERAIAPAPSTMPSYASIMTGLWPKEHGVYSNYRKVSPAVKTLAERLRDEDYLTAALLDGSFPGTFPNLGQGFSFVVQRGITAATPLPSPAEGARTLYYALLSATSKHLNWGVSATTISALHRLSEFPADRALFVHFYWPFAHAPYNPTPRFLNAIPAPDPPSRTADLIRRYDAEILFADAQVGRIFEMLEKLGRYREAWIIFTADHGEELGRIVPDSNGGDKQFFGHSRYLFDASVRVPLIVRAPDSRNLGAWREPSVVTTVSIAATLLHATGVELDPALARPLPLKPAHETDDPVISVARSSIQPIDVVSIRTRDWRLIETRRPSPMLELYHDGRDAISDNVAEDHPEVVDELLARLHRWDPPNDLEPATPESLGISEKERESLEALRYLF